MRLIAFLVISLLVSLVLAAADKPSFQSRKTAPKLKLRNDDGDDNGNGDDNGDDDDDEWTAWWIAFTIFIIFLVLIALAACAAWGSESVYGYPEERVVRVRGYYQ
jgi:hypothetical protein